MSQHLVEFAVLLYVAGLLTLVAGFAGIEIFGDSDFVKTGFPAIIPGIGGYTSDQFIGIGIGTVCLPVGCWLLSWAVWLSKTHLKVGSLHIALACLHAAFVSVMYTRWNARNLIECGVFLCALYGPKTKENDTANGYYQCKCPILAF